MITREFFKWVASFIMATVIIALVVIGFDQPIVWIILMVAILTAVIRFWGFK